MQVHAAVVNGPTDKFTFETLNLREPLDDEVLVKITCSGLCGCDLHYMHAKDQTYPIVMGHEGAGIIEKMGKSVSGFKIGDHVIIATNNCGKCKPCQEGRFWDCEHAFDYWYGKQFDRTTPLSTKDGKPVRAFSCHGTFADHAVVRACTLVRVDPSVDLRHVCFLACCPITGAGGVLNYFKAQPGHSLAVIGMGTVGLTGIMAAKIAGLKSIIAIDRHPEKLQLAQKFGATLLINPNEDKDLTALAEFVKKNGQIDYCEDTTGNKELVKKVDLHLSDKTERYDITGDLGNDKWPFACIGNSDKNVFIPQMIEYYREGKFPLNEFLTYYKFDDINKAYDDLVGKKAIRPIVTFE